MSRTPSSKPNEQKSDEREWYLKLPEQIRKDGDELFFTLHSNLFQNELKELRTRPGSDWVDFGLMHKACVYYMKKIYDLTAIKIGKLEKIKKLKNEKNKKVKERKVKFVDKNEVERLSFEIENLELELKNQVDQSYQRTKKFLENHPNFSTGFIVDAIASLEDEYGVLVTSDGHTVERENPISFWASIDNRAEGKRKYGPEVLLLKIIQKHIADIAEQNLEVELDEEVAITMPNRAIEKVWQMDYKLGKSNVALHELTNAKQLDVEGVLMANCVGEKNWERQIEIKPETGKPEVRIFSLGIEADSSEFFTVGETDGGEELKNSWAEDFMNKVRKKFNLNIVDRDGQEADFSSLETCSSDFNNLGIRLTFWTKEVDDFYKQENEKLVKKLKVRICRIPLVTIMYDVNKKGIEQIKLFGNQIIDMTSDGGLVKIVVEAIIELCKKYPVESIKDLVGLPGTKFWFKNFKGKIILKNGKVLASVDVKEQNRMDEALIF